MPRTVTNSEGDIANPLGKLATIGEVREGPVSETCKSRRRPPCRTTSHRISTSTRTFGTSTRSRFGAADVVAAAIVGDAQAVGVVVGRALRPRAVVRRARVAHGDAGRPSVPREGPLVALRRWHRRSDRERPGVARTHDDAFGHARNCTFNEGALTTRRARRWSSGWP